MDLDARRDPPSPIAGSPSSLSLDINSPQVTRQRSLDTLSSVACPEAVLILWNVFEFP
ncbi:hypothetical protein SAY86_000296 [Trapa natans]|uniref:Uncharacterized protein n=1 Tax=Trapa natans TaxID=22666 RepID=A0AAN7M3S9_TRANT|nr:hypothetical protein SAY86_000296 [Trapa natans]